MCAGLNEPFQLFLELAKALIKVVKNYKEIIAAKKKMTFFLFFSLYYSCDLYLVKMFLFHITWTG